MTEAKKFKGSKIKVGIVGLGGAGRAHARRLSRNPFVGEIFGFDIKKITGIKNVTIVNTLNDLFDKVDAITICTPDQAHLDGIILALEAGKHVLSEKPMTSSLKEAMKLKPYLKKYKNQVFGVHHQMRCSPAFLKAKEVINSGKLGKLFYIEANYWHDMRGRATKYDNWRIKEGQGQSLIFAHGCHPADLMMNLIGSKPEKHSTFVSKNSFTKYNADYTSATSLMQFPENIIGKMHINSSCVYPEVYDLVIMGDLGTYIDGVIYTKKSGFKQLADFFGDSGWFSTEMIIREMAVPKKILSFVINLYLRTFNRLAIMLMKEPDFGFRRFPLTSYNHDYACQYIINNFIETIRGNERIIASYEDATRAIALCEELEKDGMYKFTNK